MKMQESNKGLLKFNTKTIIKTDKITGGNKGKVYVSSAKPGVVEDNLMH